MTKRLNWWSTHEGPAEWAQDRISGWWLANLGREKVDGRHIQAAYRIANGFKA